MNELQIFTNEEFGDIRTVQLNNETYFVGKDVAEALAYGEPHKAIVRHVEEEDRTKHPTLTKGGYQDAWMINESGLYALIFGSKLESAKRFKHWVTSEVLPAIRKNGSYQKPMTAVELLQVTQEAILEVNEKVLTVDKDLQAFKQDMPILGIEEGKITSAVRRKGVACLGGKNSEAYQDKSIRGKVYADIYGQLKRQFGVDTYKAIKRSMCEQAVAVIENYELPLILEEQIEDCNSQMCLM